jgi:DNA-binding MarR family transcriptional regulator
MKDANNNEAVYWLLMQIMFQAKHGVQAIAETHGLTLMQSNTLTMLKEDTPLAMRVVSDYFSCDASNVTGIVDRLEARGLIKRQDHPTDRRIKLIALTTEGMTLRDLIMTETVKAEAARLSPILDSHDRQTLHALLQRIVDAQRETPAT